MSSFKNLSRSHQAQVRVMIAKVYLCVFGAPSPSTWGAKFKQKGLVSQVSKMLNLPTGSSRSVRRTMLATWKTVKDKSPESVDPSSRSSREAGPRPFKIEPGSKYEKMVCELLEHGNSIRITQAIVSGQMRLDGVLTFSSKSPILSIVKRLNPIRNNFKKANQASDSHSAWVKARYNWCLHLLVRLGHSSDPITANALLSLRSSSSSPLPSWLDHDTLSNQGYAIDVHQIAHFDEVHVKQKYGHGEFQLRFKREDGELVRNEDDAYATISADSGYGPERFRRVFKFEEEARMMLGVSAVRVKIQDCFVTRGVRCPLFDYTGKNIVGMGKWKKLVSQAIMQAKNSTTTYWVSKSPRPAGKEIFEFDELLNVPRIGRKTANLLNKIGLFTVKDVMDCINIDDTLESLSVSDNRRKSISSLLHHAASKANPGKLLNSWVFNIPFNHFTNINILYREVSTRNGNCGLSSMR